MSNWLVASIGIVYLIVGIDQALKGNWPGCLTWCCYGFANFGLMHTVK
jgi:hypothetical protein